MSTAGGEESSHHHSLDVQKWVWAPVSGRLQWCISLLQTRAGEQHAAAGVEETGINRLYAAVIIIT